MAHSKHFVLAIIIVIELLMMCSVTSHFRARSLCHSPRVWAFVFMVLTGIAPVTQGSDVGCGFCSPDNELPSFWLRGETVHFARIPRDQRKIPLDLIFGHKYQDISKVSSARNVVWC